MDKIPPHIHTFIRENNEQLNDIYGNEKEKNGPGYLNIRCDTKENKIDVFYINEETKKTMFTKEFCEGVEKGNIDDKKIFIVQELNLNSMFILYI